MDKKILVISPGATLVISSPVFVNASKAKEPDAQLITSTLHEHNNETLLALNCLIAAEIERRGLTDAAAPPDAAKIDPPIRKRRKRPKET